MEKLSQAGHKKTGSKTTIPLTNSAKDSGHTEMAMQTPYRSDQCVQQMLCRLTGIYEPLAPKVVVASAPIAPEQPTKGDKRH